MKKIILIITGAALAFASCSKDTTTDPVIPVDPELGTNQMRAVAEQILTDDGTRSIMDAQKNVIWQFSDNVGVMTADNLKANLGYTIMSDEDALNGIFSLDDQVEPNGATYYAYYPRETNAAINEDLTFPMELSATQTYAENSFGKLQNPSIAVSTVPTAYLFKNICSYLNVQLQGEAGLKVQTIIITPGITTTADGTRITPPLAGKGQVDFSDYEAGPVFKLDENAAHKSITLTCGFGTDGIALDPTNPTSFYFVVPAGEYSAITVDVYTTDGVMQSFVKGLADAKITFTRNKVTTFRPYELTSVPTQEVIPVGDTYTVTNAAEWNWIAAQVNIKSNSFKGKTVELGNNIDMAGEKLLIMGIDADYKSNITMTNTAFEGDFNGNNHTISNLTIDTDGRARGLFGHTKGGTIKNLTLDGVTITGAGKWVGAIVGQLENGSLEECHVKNVTISVNDNDAEPYRLSYRLAGLTGYWNAAADGCHISNCSVEGITITGGSSLAGMIGGTFGKGARTISNCSLDNLKIYSKYGVVADKVYHSNAAVLGDCSASTGRIDLTNMTVGTWDIYDESGYDPADQNCCCQPYVGEFYPGTSKSQIYLDGVALTIKPYFASSTSRVMTSEELTEQLASTQTVTLPLGAEVTGATITIPTGKKIVGDGTQTIKTNVVFEGSGEMEKVTVAVPAGSATMAAIAVPTDGSTLTLNDVVIRQPNTGTKDAFVNAPAAVSLATAEGGAVNNATLNISNCKVYLTGTSNNRGINAFGDVKVNVDNTLFIAGAIATADDKTAAWSRCFNISNSTAAVVYLTNVTTKGFNFPINLMSTAQNAAVTIDGGHISGRCALNIWSNATIVVKNGAILEGRNHNVRPTTGNTKNEDFGTVVFNKNDAVKGATLTVTDATIKNFRDNAAAAYERLLNVFSDDVTVTLNGTTKLVDTEKYLAEAGAISCDYSVGMSFLSSLTIGDAVTYSNALDGKTYTGQTKIVGFFTNLLFPTAE